RLFVRNPRHPSLRFKRIHGSDRRRARDKDGSTALHCAAWNGHVDVATILLDACADIDDHNQNSHWGTKRSTRLRTEIGNRSPNCSSPETLTSAPRISTAGLR